MNSTVKCLDHGLQLTKRDESLRLMLPARHVRPPAVRHAARHLNRDQGGHTMLLLCSQAQCLVGVTNFKLLPVANFEDGRCH